MDRNEWKLAHEIKGNDGLVVRIQKRDGNRPLYSYQVGHERKPGPDGEPDDRLTLFVRVRVDAHSVARDSPTLITQALDWIEQDAKKYDYTDRRYDSDERPRNGDANRNRNGRRR